MIKKKVLTIGHSYVVALNRSLMRELDALGNVEVTVLAPQFFHGDLRSLNMEPEPQGSSLRVHPIRCFVTSRIHFFWYDPGQLAQFLDSEKFDFIYLWEEAYILSGYQVARAAQKRGIPYAIYSCQNIFKKYPWPFSHFEKNVLAGTSQAWGCGLLVDEVMKKKGHADKSRVVPFPVDLEHFHVLAPARKQAKRQDLKIHADHLIGFMGRLTPEKGCDLFLNMLSRLPKDLSWQALLLGSGPMEPALREQIRALGFADRLQIRQVHHGEVPEVLGAFDVLVAPSQPTSFWEEQFGRMIVEAFACGVPVIGSRSGEIPHVIGEAGIVVDPQDLQGWVDATRKVLTEPSVARVLTEQGLQRAQMYSARALAPLIEKNILDALGDIK